MVRPIRAEDNAELAFIIRAVMPEFGAGGEGFAIHDREVDDMFSAYSRARSAYFVCELDGEVVGGGGIAHLDGGNADTCELKKMYFLPEARGMGAGQMVLKKCLETARAFGYTYCYLETFNTMTAAMRLYEKNGFEKITGPLGNTRHFACDKFYRITL